MIKEKRYKNVKYVNKINKANKETMRRNKIERTYKPKVTVETTRDKNRQKRECLLPG